ncbi:MAG: ATP-dependent Clp protease adaptor ClpS [Cyclobacteriaceae bacterium]|nr:ATP-dependent Clp protease adaptor ClpS [Cyclobacteriaceae bacterium]
MTLSYQEKKQTDIREVALDEELRDLVVYNDDFNTFDHVINTLIKVCKHTTEQAEQCTLIIHNTGKCAVKNGSYDELRPMRESICSAGIDAKIQ